MGTSRPPCTKQEVHYANQGDARGFQGSPERPFPTQARGGCGGFAGAALTPSLFSLQPRPHTGRQRFAKKKKFLAVAGAPGCRASLTLAIFQSISSSSRASRASTISSCPGQRAAVTGGKGVRKKNPNPKKTKHGLCTRPAGTKKRGSAHNRSPARPLAAKTAHAGHAQHKHPYGCTLAHVRGYHPPSTWQGPAAGNSS